MFTTTFSRPSKSVTLTVIDRPGRGCVIATRTQAARQGATAGIYSVTRASTDRHAANDSWGGYRLDHRIAQSQATEVWEVANLRSKRTCAMKIMMPHWAGSRHVIRSLRWEYQVGVRLKHPAVIETYDYGVEHGLAYLVMEFCPAPSLKTWMQQEDTESKKLSRLVGSMAEALRYFHEQGWVHRDIKPDNFLVPEEGHAKLIDFNLAKKTPSWLRRLIPVHSKVQGTPSYMSPEQIRGEPQDVRGDIYSFGCVIFELLTGRPPYTADSANDLLNKHLRAPIPSPKKINEKISPQFAEEVQRLLGKRPDMRPGSMQEVLEKLSSLKIYSNE